MQTALTVAGPLALVAALAFSLWFVPTELATLLQLEARNRRLARVGWAVAGVVTLGCLFGLATSASRALGLVYLVSGYVFMAHVYLSIALLVMLPLRDRTRISRPVHLTAGVAAALGLTLLGGMHSYTLRVDNEKIYVDGLEESVRVVHLSDLHLGHHRQAGWLDRVVLETNRAEPDLVVITGDLVDSNWALREEVFAGLERLAAPAYYVIGNHETYIELERAVALIESRGVRVLRNERDDVAGLQIVGLEYMNADEETFDMHPSEESRTIASEMPSIAIDAARPAIVLHHSPVGVEYVRAAGADLMLAGHTHGGQVFPATLLAPFIFEYNRGLYHYEDMPIFVSQGAGTYGPSERLGTKNMIDVLHLVPAPTGD